MDKIILTHSLSTQDDSNVLVVGSCRTGKTNFFIKPNLFSLKDSVIIISKDTDELFEETASYRKEKFKQKIFTEKDFISRENLDFLGDNFTIYLTASAINRGEREELILYSFGWIMHRLEYYPPKKPITVIIDDLALFPVAHDYFKHGSTMINNIRIIATVQTIYDLKKIYKNPKNIIDLFKIKMFLNINNPDDAEYIIDNYKSKISKEEMLQLEYSQCLIVGFKKEPIFANDKIMHWFTYGNPHRKG